MKILVGLLILALAGCAAKPLVYNPELTNNRELVKLTTKHDASLFSADYDAWIIQIWDFAGNEITNRNFFADDITGVRLDKISFPAGKYKVKALCKNANASARPENIFEFESGKSYQLSCTIEKGKNMFGMSIDAYAGLVIREI